MGFERLQNRSNFLRLKVASGIASREERDEYAAMPVIIGDPSRPKDCAVTLRPCTTQEEFSQLARRLEENQRRENEERKTIIDSMIRDAENPNA